MFKIIIMHFWDTGVYQKKIRVFYAEFKHLLHIVSKYVIIRLCHSVVIVTKTKRYTKIKKSIKNKCAGYSLVKDITKRSFGKYPKWDDHFP